MFSDSAFLKADRIVHFEISVATPKFTVGFCLGEMY